MAYFSEPLMWYLGIWIVILCVMFSYGTIERPVDLPLAIKSGPFLLYDGLLGGGEGVAYHAFKLPWRYMCNHFVYHRSDGEWPAALVNLQVTVSCFYSATANITFGEGSWGIGITVEPGDAVTTRLERVLVFVDEMKGASGGILPVHVSGGVVLRLEVLEG